MAQPKQFEQIILDIEDGVAILTLNRPEKMNAFTGKMMYEMIEAFDITDADDSVRAVIVDKDNAPKWSPARLEDVSDAEVARYFEPLGPDELEFD